jgi:hypothetical protein
MQRLIFTFLFFISLNTVNAQINKDQWLAGGNGSYTSSSQKNSSDFAMLKSKSATFDVSADGGYFIFNQFCAGVRGEVNYTSDNLQEVYGSPTGNGSVMYTGISSDTRTTIWIVGPFVRYYLLKPKSKINVLADVNYLYGHSIAKSSSATVVTDQNGNFPQVSVATNKTSSNTSSFVFEAGPVWFINPKVSLELTGGYVITRYTRGYQSNAFAVGLGIHVHLSK